ncbi:hypothetical protein C5C66_06370 [Rathayibacter toxicus]|uniref:Uncharacterized protein n=1 Tax=Rathayibacter toxicus TaxID=145458 RepID=A0A0C5B9Z1_9MICO|nr:hypothetical protein TI83_06535 [Rathayibacter toxicus]ALS58150.1 hypothetical protein APU90_10550 [Rathayibacter toxicus]KKM45357.1 hypothetical protein VT73_06935 [Rathayibacter toxicus]PPH23847.1 hypothetical protein C5D17_06320 [Rathayibacter toxicus]PPH60151.1 hypothetical protein C5C93_06370 [Rathayibacter toxicus]
MACFLSSGDSAGRSCRRGREIFPVSVAKGAPGDGLTKLNSWSGAEAMDVIPDLGHSLTV